MELYRAGECLDYIGKDPKMPALRIEVTEPIRQHRLTLTAPVDTGFAGYILLDRENYERVATAELPREQFGAYQTMAGPVVLKRSRAIVGLAGRRFDSYVETPLYGMGRLLLGRCILSKLNLALLGSEHRCCSLDIEG